MGLISYIEKLREKPESHRRRVQLLVSLLVTFVVAVFWAFTFGADIGNALSNKDDAKPSPFRLLSDSFKGVISNIQEGASVTVDKISGNEQEVIDDDANLINVGE